MARLIKRSDIWIADLNPGFGVEIHKKRPVLVISANEINRHWPRVIVIPFSSQTNPLGPEKVFIAKGTFKLNKDSVILASDIRSIDKSRLIKKVGRLTTSKMKEVEESIKLVLSLEENS